MTDQQYNILKFKRKSTWGIHLFDRAESSEERQLFRTKRRRIDRRKWRLSLLNGLFEDAISTVDPDFLRLFSDEASYHSASGVTSFGKGHDDFPTVYHLRRYLMTTTDTIDIRSVYIACHHIIKYRGHFLYGHSGSDDIPSLTDAIDSMVSNLRACGLEYTIIDEGLFVDTISDGSLSVMEKRHILQRIIKVNDPKRKRTEHKVLCDLLAGSNIRLFKLFGTDFPEGSSFSLRGRSFDQFVPEQYDDLDNAQMGVLSSIERVYDLALLSNVTDGFHYISDYKIDQYDRHRRDLQCLKEVIRKYAPERYSDVFRNDGVKGNYCSYVGRCGNSSVKVRCNQEELCRYLGAMLDDIDLPEDPRYSDMMERIENRTFLPRQRLRDNVLFPNSLHHIELEMILNNASQQHPFLLDKDENGLSVKDRILMLHRFRIPYYIGPLGGYGRNSWAVRRSDEHITPWNFESVVDIDATIRSFMDHCTKDCSYLIGEKVLPRDSALYSRFLLYDEINGVRIDGEPIPPFVKTSLIRDLFLSGDMVTRSGLLSYLIENRVIPPGDHTVTGLGKGFSSTLRSEHLLRGIIHDRVDDVSLCESIVRTIVTFRDPPVIRRVLMDAHPTSLSDTEIDSLSKLSFKGWSDVSMKLLIGIQCPDDRRGREYNLLEMLERTSLTSDELLTGCFSGVIDSYNGPSDGDVTYDSLDRYDLSPSQKRTVWRSVVIVKDVVDNMGHVPKKVFLETVHNTARIPLEHSIDRRGLLLTAFSSPEDKVWHDLTSSYSESDLKSRNLFLYLSQMGHCIYCGRELSRADVKNTDVVSRDHIVPSSKVLDDDLHNNLVLCCRSCNSSKGDSYPISRGIQVNMYPFWEKLRSRNCITREKFNRLTRTEYFSDRELVDAMGYWKGLPDPVSNAMVDVLRRSFGKDLFVCHVSSELISRLRSNLGILRNRSVNHNHHAKDAYLAIVGGNVHHTFFTDDPTHLLRDEGYYNLNKMYSHVVERDGLRAWTPGKDGSEAIVRKCLRRDDTLFTRYQQIQNGMLFDDTLQKAGDNLFDRKRDLPAAIYGGYQKERGACYSLIEYGSEGSSVRSLEVLPRHSVGLLDDITELERYYSERKGVSVSVKVPVIRMYQRVDWNGFPLHIAGRSNQHIMYYPAIQMLLPDDIHEYCRRIDRFIADSRMKYVRPPDYYGMDEGGNIRVLDHLISKCGSEPYVRMFRKFHSNLLSIRDRFIHSNVGVQSEVLYGILLTFRCDASDTNLRKVGGPASTGRIMLNKVLQNDSSGIYLVNQSPSGLRENRIRIDRGDIRN